MVYYVLVGLKKLRMVMRNQFKLMLFIFIPLLWASTAYGEDEAKSAVYVKLSKGMVVNYGDPSLSRLKYMKIAVQVRMNNAIDAEAIEHHMPALLDSLIILFSSCDEDLIASAGGREEIRQRALDAVQNVIQREEGEPLVEDLLFGSFIIQK